MRYSTTTARDALRVEEGFAYVSSVTVAALDWNVISSFIRISLMVRIISEQFLLFPKVYGQDFLPLLFVRFIGTVVAMYHQRFTMVYSLNGRCLLQSFSINQNPRNGTGSSKFRVWFFSYPGRSYGSLV